MRRKAFHRWLDRFNRSRSRQQSIDTRDLLAAFRDGLDPNEVASENDTVAEELDEVYA